MITKDAIPRVIGHTLYDGSNKKLGKIGQVYIDDRTGQPEWMTVHTGMFGTKETFVPIETAQLRGEEVVVPYQKDQIKDAPTVDTEAGGHLSEQEEGRLFDYYGLTPSAAPPRAETPGVQAETMGGQAAGEAMTRAEEHLRVGKETRETGRARLKKYVVTEEEQQSVPVRKEKLRIEREPITEEDRGQAMREPGIAEQEQEMVLHEERPVAATETVPVERVRMGKETDTEQETVRGRVRKEHIKTEGMREDEEFD